MRFIWDLAKDERNRLERGIGFALAAFIFDGDVLTSPDNRRDYGELRQTAVGMAEGLCLHVVFTDRGDERRIISVRRADRKERRQWTASR